MKAPLPPRDWWNKPLPTGSRWQRWLTYTAPFRRRFGAISGIRAARQLARVEYLDGGDAQEVRVPGWTYPIWLRPGTADIVTYRQLILGDELDILLDPAPARIIDGGANIGLASRIFARRWPDADIVAVELDSGNYRQLERNTRHLPRFRRYRAALWGRSGRVSIAKQGLDENSYRVVPGMNGESVDAVPIDRLLERVGWDRVDLIKLDVEGAEREILAGAASWLGRVRHLIIELHERFSPGCQAAFDAAIDPAEWSMHRHGEYVVASRRPVLADSAT